MINDIIATYTIPKWFGLKSTNITFGRRAITDGNNILKYSDIYYINYGVEQEITNGFFKEEYAFFAVSDRNDSGGIVARTKNYGLNTGRYYRSSNDLLEKLVPMARQHIEPIITENWIRILSKSDTPVDPLLLGDHALLCSSQAIHFFDGTSLKWENLLGMDIAVQHNKAMVMIFDRTKNQIPLHKPSWHFTDAEIVISKYRPFTLINKSIWPTIAAHMFKLRGGTGPLWLFGQNYGTM